MEDMKKLRCWGVWDRISAGIILAGAVTNLPRQLSFENVTQVGGFPVSVMNQMELELLLLLDFDVWVWDDQYFQCERMLEEY